jgi:hypothetical protein
VYRQYIDIPGIAAQDGVMDIARDMIDVALILFCKKDVRQQGFQLAGIG